MLTNPEVYQKVWFMENNLPCYGNIFSIKETVNQANRNINHIVIEIGTSDSNVGIYNINNLYESKEELQKAIFGE